MWLCFAVTAPYGSLLPREDLLRGRELKRACGGLTFPKRPDDAVLQLQRKAETGRACVRFRSGMSACVAFWMREVYSGEWRVKTKDRRQVEEESVQAGRFK